MFDYELININNQIFNNIRLKFSEDDINIQQEYFEILDRLIDAVISLKYEKMRRRLFKFNFVNEINDYLLACFEKIDDTNEERILTLAIKQFNSLDKDIATRAVLDVYKIYLENNKSLPQEETIQIYNFILNEQQNVYFSIEKDKLTNLLKNIMPLSRKKENLLYTSAKREEVIRRMQDDKYDELNFSKSELESSVEEMHKLLDGLKPFNTLTKEEISLCDKLFFSGSLDEENIIKFCPSIPKKIIKKILAKYNKLLLSYAEGFNIQCKINFNTVKYNYNHLKIINNKKYDMVFDTFLKKISKDNKRWIVEHLEEVKDVFKLLPFTYIPIFEEYFNIDIFISILLNYPLIKHELLSQNDKEKYDFTYMLNNLKDVIMLSKVYNEADEFAISILGENNIKKIINNNRRTSCEPTTYIDIYRQMLNKTTINIPPISFYYRIKGVVYKVESGTNYDVERLLIGKNCYNSCISPLGSGEQAYRECLTKKSGDAILVKNAITGEFYARSLIFRRGNTLILSNFVNSKSISKKLYDKDFLYVLGNMLLRSAKEQNDNIYYVLINKLSFDNESSYISNRNLHQSIPHCDMSGKFDLIATNKNMIDINTDENIEGKYLPYRQNVIKKQQDYIYDIKRIKALYGMYCSNINEAKRSFNNVGNNFRAVYIGQDFYIAVKEDYSIESIKLPIDDKRQEQEIENCINDIIKIQMMCNSENSQYNKIFIK